jgi:hypothetical protein
MIAQSQRRTLLSFCSLRVPRHPTRLLPFRLRTLSFWLLMPKGERQCVDSGGAYERVLVLWVLLSYIMFATLHLHCMTYVFLSYSCDMLCFIGLIPLTCHLFGDLLVCPASTFYSIFIRAILSCTNLSCLILWVHYVGLGHISNPFNPVSNCLLLMWTKHVRKPQLLNLLTRGVVINHQKRGDWKHLGP